MILLGATPHPGQMAASQRPQALLQQVCLQLRRRPQSGHSRRLQQRDVKQIQSVGHRSITPGGPQKGLVWRRRICFRFLIGTFFPNKTLTRRSNLLCWIKQSDFPSTTTCACVYTLRVTHSHMHKYQFFYQCALLHVCLRVRRSENASPSQPGLH